MQVSFEVDNDFDVIAVDLEFNVGPISITQSFSFDKGEEEFNKLYESMVNNTTEFNFSVDDRVDVIADGNSNLIFTGEGYTMKFPVKDVIDAFRKLYLANNDLVEDI
jgi:hypothetical protein